jgi:hypothetical protein
LILPAQARRPSICLRAGSMAMSCRLVVVNLTWVDPLMSSILASLTAAPEASSTWPETSRLPTERFAFGSIKVAWRRSLLKVEHRSRVQQPSRRLEGLSAEPSRNIRSGSRAVTANSGTESLVVELFRTRTRRYRSRRSLHAAPCTPLRALSSRRLLSERRRRQLQLSAVSAGDDGGQVTAKRNIRLRISRFNRQSDGSDQDLGLLYSILLHLQERCPARH